MNDSEIDRSFSPLVASLEMINAFAQRISTSLDPLQIGQTALAMLREEFSPLLLALYQADPLKRVVRLLCASRDEADDHAPLSLPRSLSYNTRSPLTDVSRQRTPIRLTDLHDPALAESPSLRGNLLDERVRGCLCIPLWSGTSFEGSLLITFATPLAPGDGMAQTIINCALHLATALANARLHLTVENERVRQRMILDQLPEGTLITEAASGTVSYANEAAAQILGVPLDEVVGFPLHILTHIHANHPPFRDGWPFFPWTFAVIRALGGEMVSQMEAVVVRPEGANVPVLCSCSPLRTSQGVISGAIITFQDITVQKNLEVQKNFFFACASHELRTPLTVVMGYADLLQQMTSLESVDQLDLSMLYRASQHICIQVEQMTYLIDEMLDLSHLDHGHLVMRMATIDLLLLVRRVVENLAATTNRHQIYLVVDDDGEAGEHVMVSADVVHLSHALNNLITNAIKYSPQGGQIEVGLRLQKAEASSVLVWVKDHGLGIAQSDLPHLFTRFYRVPSLDKAISGLGIGLYLAKEIVERHDGQIRAESVEGQGSTFFFSLPLQPS